MLSPVRPHGCRQPRPRQSSRMNRTVLLFAPLLSLLTPITAQAKLDLKPALRKGDACEMVSRMKRKQSIDFGAQQIETATNITCILLFRITDVAADGALSVELTVKRISGTLDGGP